MVVPSLSGKRLISELCKERKLSARASNICIRNKVCDISALLRYYNEHGDFMAFQGMGARTNSDLQRLCKELPEMKSTSIIALEVYHQLSAEVQRAIQDFLELILSKCSARTLNALKKLSGDFTFDAIARAFSEPQFRFENVRYVGVKTAAELRSVTLRIQSLLNDVKSRKYND